MPGGRPNCSGSSLPIRGGRSSSQFLEIAGTRLCLAGIRGSISTSCMSSAMRGASPGLMKQGLKRQVDKGLQRELRPKPVLYTAVRWAIVNIATESSAGASAPTAAIRIRYEDFVANPAATLDRIVALVDERATTPCRELAPADVTPQHQVAGSRHRMRAVITVRTRRTWKVDMPASQQIARRFRLARRCCGRYGYALRPSSNAGRRSMRIVQSMAERLALGGFWSCGLRRSPSA